MVGLKLKQAFQFKKSDPSDAEVPGKIGKLRSVANELHPQDYEALQPLLTLLNVHARKSYAYESVPGTFALKLGNKGFLPVSKLSMVGTTLTLYMGNVNTLGVYDEVISVDTKLLWDHIILEDGSNYVLTFDSTCNFALYSQSVEDLRQLSKLISIAQFEYGSLCKSLTASVISLMGLKMPDIHVVLNNKFSFKDWCFIYINNEWVKVWCHIDKKSKAIEGKGKARVAFYRDDKSTSKKNLVCFLSEDIEDIFVSTDPTRPPNNSDDDWKLDQLKALMHSGLNSADALDTFLERLDTISVIGAVNWVNPDSSSDSPTSSRSRSSSFVWTPKSVRNRASSTSDSKAKARARDDSISNLATLTKHARSFSVTSNNSTSATDLDDTSFEVSTQRFLFKPIPHGGVHHLETIIRFLVPAFDCLQLYGRPTSFKSGRDDISSLSFGLPKLPTIDYFSEQELNLFLQKSSFDVDTVKRFQLLKLYLQNCMELGSRCETQSFRNLADSWDIPTAKLSLSAANSSLKYSTALNRSNDSPPIV